MLTVSIYRRTGRWLADNDATNGGISRDAAQLTIVNIDGPDYIRPSDEFPAAMLVKHCPFGDLDGRRMVRVVPAVQGDGGEWQPAPGWSMFGGNYAACSDSRFSEALRELLGVNFYGAVPIHDRYE